ncbi:zinc-binding alcohol dehydrogenase family protein [Kitasatospora sp. MAP5-34]|uniref:quinone oxidoreductase family protein n=1 Tax=Kitasatospora sp. MAP5-34 TaxID=3035102 RepID=UPI002476BC42|nr:zinc-binding alcohol dehydrogenase family protein [Kitasatospora sp. MAP5-34]MDH6574597.1 NADPH2:quinone reductase [Kitasatospora sp. MAP5-34]
MKSRVLAARLADLGGVPVVTEVELSDPAAGEAVVDMYYAGLNPLDTYVIQGSVGGNAVRPRTLGVEGVGLCDGRPVVVHGGGLGIVRDGTWSGRVLAPRDALVPVPDGVALEAAAAAAVVGTTAIRVTWDVGAVRAHDRVLVLGASGGVGQAVSSLCRAAGAQVWGQTGNPDKVKAIAASGVTPISASGAAELMVEADPVVPTVVFDALGGEFTAAAVELLADHGRLITYGASAGPDSTLSMRTVYRKNLTIAGYGGVSEPPARIRAGTELALHALRDGQLVIPVHEIYPLARVGEALRALTGRTATGKILLDVRSQPLGHGQAPA